MTYTVLGSSGFIGSNLVDYLELMGNTCHCPPRNFNLDSSNNLGHVFYCIGLTADFRSKPFETVEAHVCYLKKILKDCRYESFTYLSSTRVYNNSSEGKETCDLSVNPNSFSDLYNISKLMGESICLSIPNDNVRIIRLSNVIGEDIGSKNFIYSLINEAKEKKKIILQQSKNIKRDYISIDDVVRLVVKISTCGKERIYNLASGVAISNERVVNLISSLTNCTQEFASDEEVLNFPEVNIERIRDEFAFEPKKIEPLIEQLIKS